MMPFVVKIRVFGFMLIINIMGVSKLSQLSLLLAKWAGIADTD